MKILFCLVSFFSFCSGFTQEWEWTRRVNGLANDYVSDIHYDDNGYVYITGRSKEAVVFEDDVSPQVPIYYGHTDAYVAKYDLDGNLQWANQAGGTGPDWGWGICTDEFGNVYYVGEVSDTAYFGQDTVICQGTRDAFIAKLDVNGNYVWVKTISTSGEDKSKDIDIDEDGDLYVTGYINDTLTVNGMLIGTPVTRNAFILKMDTDGNYFLVKDVNPRLSAGYHIKSDKRGGIYLTGELLYNSYVAGYLVTGSTGLSWRDAFLAKLDQNLTTQWVQLGKGPYHNIGESIAISDSAVYMVGCYAATSDFSGISLTYNGDGTSTSTHNSSRDMFISKYDFDGNIIWAKGFGGEDYDYAYGVDVTKDDNIYVTGVFEDTVMFDSYQLISAGGWDVFIIKLDENGNVIWAKRQGNNDTEYGYGIQIDDNENVYSVGAYRGGGQFFDSIWMPIVEYTGFVGKLTQHTNPEFTFNNTPFCEGDTVKLIPSMITTPITSTWHNMVPSGWLEGDNYCFIVSAGMSSFSGELRSSNNIYSDTLFINEPITVSSPSDCGLGFSDEDKFNWVYNPITQLMSFQINSSSGMAIIYNVNGQVLGTSMLNSGENCLDLSNYSKGVCVVQIFMESKSTQSIKIVR